MEKSIKRLEQQIDVLYQKFIYVDHFEDFSSIYQSLYSLSDLYYELTGKCLLDQSQLERPFFFLWQEKRRESQGNRLFINHFLNCRSFHRSLLGLMLKEMESIIRKMDQTFEYRDFRLSFSKEELQDLLFSYLKEKFPKGEEIVRELIEDNRLILCSSNSILDHSVTIANTYQDFYHNLFFIKVPDFQQTLENVGSIVHECGHIEDVMNLSYKELTCFLMSGLFEVNAIYRESEFYLYLLKNHIHPKEVERIFLSHSFGHFEFSYSLLLLSNISKYGLKRDRYKRFSSSKLQEFSNHESFSDLFVIPTPLDINREMEYSYGEILSTYFLEHPEKYILFKEKRCDFFSPKLFQELGMTEKDICCAYQKKYEKYR